MDSQPQIPSRFFDPMPMLGSDPAHKPIDEPLVTVASFNDPTMAHVGRLALEGEGIVAIVADESIVALDWLYANAVGGVKLQVPRSLAMQAVTILQSHTRKIEHDAIPDELTCPECGSAEVYRVTTATGLAFLSMILLSFPIPFLRRRRRCDSCGHTWKP